MPFLFASPLCTEFLRVPTIGHSTISEIQPASGETSWIRQEMIAKPGGAERGLELIVLILHPYTACLVLHSNLPFGRRKRVMQPFLFDVISVWNDSRNLYSTVQTHENSIIPLLINIFKLVSQPERLLKIIYCTENTSFDFMGNMLKHTAQCFFNLMTLSKWFTTR